MEPRPIWLVFLQEEIGHRHIEGRKGEDIERRWLLVSKGKMP